MLIAELFSVASKTFVLTGGGRGIGATIAEALVRNGATVIISSRRERDVRETAARLDGVGPGACMAMPGDVSSAAGCAAIARGVEELLPPGGGVHCLINNAGTAWGAPIAAFPEKAWDAAFATNVKGAFYMSQQLLPLLRAGAVPGAPSRIINTGSVVGVTHQPVPTYAYDASKAAVHALTRKLACDLAPAVTVNALVPGFVPSKMSRGLLAYADEGAITRGIPLGRWGTGVDMAGAVLYLSSPAAAWVTGTLLVVDGGTLAKPIHLVGEEHGA